MDIDTVCIRFYILPCSSHPWLEKFITRVRIPLERLVLDLICIRFENGVSKVQWTERSTAQASNIMSGIRRVGLYGGI